MGRPRPDTGGRSEGGSADPDKAGEVDRIRRVYDAYEADARCRSIWADTPASRYMRDRKWEAIAVVVERLGVGRPATAGAGLTGAWAIDLGAGAGSDSTRLPGAMHGLGGVIALDLLQERVAAARQASSALQPLVGDGTRLPFRSASIGVVYQSTMLSSVLDASLRAAIFAEIRRVLAPGGLFVSYDTRYPNPWNPNTRPVRLAELEASFAGWAQAGCSLTGIPQILRVLAPRSHALCRAVEAVPALRSHRLFAARKPDGVGGDGTS